MMSVQEIDDALRKQVQTLSARGSPTEATFDVKLLCRCSLVNADLSNRDLRHVLFIASDLSYADLSGSNLRGVNFSSSDLTRANLTRTDLFGATLDDSVMVDCRIDLRSIGTAGYPIAWWLSKGAHIVED